MGKMEAQGLIVLLVIIYIFFLVAPMCYVTIDPGVMLEDYYNRNVAIFIGWFAMVLACGAITSRFMNKQRFGWAVLVFLAPLLPWLPIILVIAST